MNCFDALIASPTEEGSALKGALRTIYVVEGYEGIARLVSKWHDRYERKKGTRVIKHAKKNCQGCKLLSELIKPLVAKGK